MVAILDPHAVPSVRMTVDEYLEADLPEGYRYELVDGEIQVTPVPGTLHDDILGRLNLLLVAYMQANPGKIAHLSFRAAVTIPGKTTVREPDLAAYANWAPGSAQKGEWKHRTPLLVVEVVSPGHESRDYGQKRDDYFAAGVSEYWIADGQSARLTVLARAGDDWRDQTYAPGESFESGFLSQLRVDVSHLLGIR